MTLTPTKLTQIMMINEIIKLNNIIHDAHLYNKHQVLQQVSYLLCKEAPLLDKDNVFDCLLRREDLSPTIVGDGIAIPHCRSDYIEQPVACFLSLSQGINFSPEDIITDKDNTNFVKIIFGLVVPENNHKQHLQLLADLAVILNKAEIKEKLTSAKNADEIFELLSEYEN